MAEKFVPRYKMIYDSLKANIESGAYQSTNGRLPYERELCETYGVQRITVRKALDLLVQDGLIIKKPGVGSFVHSSQSIGEQISERKTILFVMNKSQNDILSNSSAHNAQLFFLLEQYFREKGYSLIYTGITDSEVGPLLNSHSVNGVFFVSTIAPEPVGVILDNHIPAICLNHYDPRVMSILPDNQEGIFLAVKELVSLGHTKIAFIGGAENSRNAQERLNGFISAMHNSDLSISPSWITVGNWTYDGSKQAVRSIFHSEKNEDCPTAIVTASDIMAVGAMEELGNMGYKVPEDISVVGFDNVELCKYCNPQLCSVGPNIQNMAQIAMEHMIYLIENNQENSCYTIRMPVKYYSRMSVMVPKK